MAIKVSRLSWKFQAPHNNTELVSRSILMSRLTNSLTLNGFPMSKITELARPLHALFLVLTPSYRSVHSYPACKVIYSLPVSLSHHDLPQHDQTQLVYTAKQKTKNKTNQKEIFNFYIFCFGFPFFSSPFNKKSLVKHNIPPALILKITYHFNMKSVAIWSSFLVEILL